MESIHPETDDPIRDQHKRFVEALKSGAVDELMSLQCDDAIWMPPNETSLYGKAEIQEWFEEYFEHFRITTMLDTDREVEVHDHWAAEQCTYIVAINPLKGGERIRDDGRTFILWKQTPAGEWRMSQVMFNSMRPVGSGTTRFLVRMMQEKGSEAINPLSKSAR